MKLAELLKNCLNCVAGIIFYAVLTSGTTLAQETSTIESPEPINTQDQSKLEQEQVLLPQFDLVDNPAMDQRIRDLLINNVTVFNRPPEKISPAELRLLRSAVRRQMKDILATEGYFSPVFKFTNAFANEPDAQAQRSIPNQLPEQQVVVHVNLDLGPPTKVTNVQLDFAGDTVPADLQQSIQQKWDLQKDAQFRDKEWSQAKAGAIETLIEHGYAAAKIANSEALIQNQQAELSVLIEGGPIFRVGELTIQGLTLYDASLLERYRPPVKGDVYSQAQLIRFQRALQNSPYFSSATVSIESNPDMATAVPINVLVQERKEYDIGLAAGYSTNTGARGELSFQDRDFFRDAWNLKSVLRIEQRRQIGYADIFLPPTPSGYLDSFGMLFERSDIAGLLTQSTSFGAKRVTTENFANRSIEKRLGLSFIYEHSTVNGGADTYAKALVPSIGRTWRAVDNTFDPHHGRITQLDISGAAKLAISDQNFLRLYGKHQQWIPVNRGDMRDVIILRAEGGYVLAADDVGIPEDFLFRAGGTGSVRGYSYQSLGVNQAGGVVGGRMMVTLSAEYVHWLRGKNWGVAGFVDAGDAADRVADLKMKQGIGLGARYKTPAGPIAIDLAYGRQAKKVRLDFFIAIAF